MSFGYIGDTSTSVKQQVKNKGILTTQESFDLERQGFLGGSLELIQSQTISSSVSTITFTSIKESKYDVHLLQIDNLQRDTNGTTLLQFSNDGGSSFETSSYENADVRNQSNSSFQEDRSTSATSITLTNTAGASANESVNMYCYFYNLGNSSKYSFVTLQGSYLISSTYATTFGGGVYSVAETINAFQILASTSVNYDSGNIKLYGVKQI